MPLLVPTLVVNSAAETRLDFKPVGHTVHLLFPADARKPSVPDDFFAEEAAPLASAGFSYSTFTDDSAELQGIPAGEQVVYRGWMLDAPKYTQLLTAIESAGGTPFTSLMQYLMAHHLPNWYALIPDLTPETRTFSADADLVSELRTLGWDAYFVKDYVKSLKTSVGSLIRDPAVVEQVVAEMKSYRGEIEGGVCVRRVEDFLPETEIRYFVVRGRAFAPDGSNHVPAPVCICAERIPNPFFSVDVIQRRDGVLRVVEVGDGQVSDLVGWSPQTFAEMWRASGR
jgi:hypothetical protein